MFSCEKELVEKLVLDLQEKYNTKYIVRELRAGNNIADIAYTTNLHRENIVFDEYFNAYYYVNGIYSKKSVPISDIDITNAVVNKKFHTFLRELEELGYIKIEKNKVTSLRKVDTATKNLVAVEAKLSDWRLGLEQAIRYKQYANEVYIALSSEHIDKVDINLLKTMDVGLMSVSNGKLKIPLKGKKVKVEKLDIQYYVLDRFLKQLSLT